MPNLFTPSLDFAVPESATLIQIKERTAKQPISWEGGNNFHISPIKNSVCQQLGTHCSCSLEVPGSQVATLMINSLFYFVLFSVPSLAFEIVLKSGYKQIKRVKMTDYSKSYTVATCC